MSPGASRVVSVKVLPLSVHQSIGTRVVPQVHEAQLEDRHVADRDPDTIKQEIDAARDQLAATVDSLAVRANPRRLADDLKAQVISFVTKPVVAASLAGVGALVVVVVVRRVRNR
ncbi:hypothetical protein NJB14197_38800 [Mycobacterium montefiorense]|uniref:DUF3618 domain-containing protein n=1 Tax=Mycobacterium montefiorense TaxID=154654 RepID=A0AA37PQL6_9MYCO|nr:hypothetical protein MmonteBS_40060 [Mycobacterium montefiorense]GKU35505.1 hypothetical protein NJB14191_28510 [Mycobacterium montefiorense]GKU40510.1 hypothetical protein NJB14192_24970 [Mycobacterium montefiorense]GKU45013.1 hypothetical protein NJB14194_16370 [Mycobacterium montefiorense]GKU51163.1 hypothetical protein NJB14195_24090 [Mycobacterium montefiorense]